MATATNPANSVDPNGKLPQFNLLEAPRATRWAVFDIVLYVIMQLVYGFVAMGIAMGFGMVPSTIDPALMDLRALMSATIIGLVLASAHMLYLRRGSLRQAWHYRPAPHLKWPKLISIGLLVAALGLGAVYTHFINQPLQPEYQILGTMVTEGGWRAIAVLLAVVVFGPAVEELLFRVQFQSAVAKKLAPKMGEQKAIAFGMIASTIFFAFIHFQLTASPVQLMLGGALAIIYQRHRSFAEVWLLHAAVNLLGILTING